AVPKAYSASRTSHVVARMQDSRYFYYCQSSIVDMQNLPHQHRVYDDDGEVYFCEIQQYLKFDEMPPRVHDDPSASRTFIRRAAGFVIHDGRLWKIHRKALPRLVIADNSRRLDLLKQAHDDCGHRGRDPTY
ncbi:uncharacterized protein LAESUDRAFT_613139, partial [Laetiporus sulphureus 93-53]